jgi:NAD(P)-dependent dehydrogenase (short-subunit alcohol dehydrogenase family)
MRIEKSVAFVTGANRGLGREFTRALLEGGAAKVYGGARDPHTITEPGVVPVALDITDPGAVAAAAALAGDVTLLINNAGTSSGGSLLTASGPTSTPTSSVRPTSPAHSRRSWGQTAAGPCSTCCQPCPS